MRLLHSKTYELREFVDNEANKVEYAILSHTWDREEVIFQDMQTWMGRYTRKLGWKKIEYCCSQARQDGIDWVWMDTVCIDKSSSAELSEAINSMFTWYHDAEVCYAYLADISAARWSTRDHYSCLQDSRWFSRGWTLQELLAPQRMILYGADWNQLGARDELSNLISQVSGIQVTALQGDEKDIDNFSIAQRMCWASRRETTRSEDIAYCLLGLFDVNMPLLYGEGGKKAFIRLQEEIMKNSDDHTLFAWTVPEEVGSHSGAVKEVGLLAEHPVFFSSSKDVLSFRRWDVSDTFSMTNKGLRITVPLRADVETRGNWIAYLDCHQQKDNQRCAFGIPLQQLSLGGDQFARVAQATLDIPLSLEHEVTAEKREIYIRKEIIKPDDAIKEGDFQRLQEFRLLQIPSTHELVEKYGSAREGSSSETLLAPPKTTSYWIDPLSWANWRVVCVFEERGSVYRAQTSSFIVVLGCGGHAANSWCVIEPYHHQSLRDVWGGVRRGESESVNKILFKGRSTVRVDIKPAVDNPLAADVYVQCSYGLGESSDAGALKSMDPLSIFSGTDSVANICFHLVTYLEDTIEALSTFKFELKQICVDIEKSTRRFIEDLKALGAANKAIQTLFHKEISTSRSPIPETFWKETAKGLKNCLKAVEELKRLLEDIFGNRPRSSHNLMLTRESLNLKAKRSKSKRLKQSFDNVSIYHKILHMSLLMAIQYDNEGGYGDAIISADELSREIEASQSLIATMLNTIRELETSAIRDRAHELITWTAINDLRAFSDAATAVIKSEKPKTHFHIPQALSPIFTGRSDSLASLRSFFLQIPPAVQGDQQRRFVIHGIGGAGKTQFCTKFANENRDRYWGVFWIDLSSPESISLTCAQIASIGGVEPTMNAAMHWLSSVKRQYLLILDNADDPSLSLSDYFPQSDSGHILVTTRNPTNIVYGNIGCRSFHFEKLEDGEASSLLLKAAGQALPWDDNVVSKASKITQALGSHPLAITNAGRAIITGLCTLETYLSYYERSFIRLRTKRRQRYEDFDGMDHSIYSSFEISFISISSKDTQEAKDAVHLLKVFAFFHYENIRFDILERAIRNPAKEKEQQERDEERDRLLKDDKGDSTRVGWYRTLAVLLVANRTPPILPDAIRDGQMLGFDPDRLRIALTLLVQLSLIVRNDLQNIDSYSMHPLVHRWARERPEMSLAEQGLWSEAAATVLSYSLLFPPLGSTPEEESFGAAVLPHVIHVLICQTSIRDRISDTKRVGRGLLSGWFHLPYFMSVSRVRTNIKLSLVLAHAGLFSEAEKLQVPAMHYLLQSLGIEHKITRRIMVTLAHTQANSGRLEEAESTLNRVLQACNVVLRSDDHETLLAKGALGATLCMQGRYTEARKLQKEVVVGLTDINGRRSEDTLVAIDNLGVTIMNLREEYREAQKCHREAAEGLEEMLGPADFRTGNAKENLSVVAVYIPGEDLKSAAAMIDEVLENRRFTVGKEHYSTLRAMHTKAKIKSALNELDEAKHLIKTLLPVAERNSGRDHDSTVMARYSLAKILNKQKQWKEAEDILLEVIDHFRRSYPLRQDNHSNRGWAIVELVECYKLQGREEENHDLYVQILDCIRRSNDSDTRLLRRWMQSE